MFSGTPCMKSVKYIFEEEKKSINFRFSLLRFKTEEIQVKLGEYDFNAAGETQDQQYAVQSVIVHQQGNIQN